MNLFISFVVVVFLNMRIDNIYLHRMKLRLHLIQFHISIENKYAHTHTPCLLGAVLGLTTLKYAGAVHCTGLCHSNMSIESEVFILMRGVEDIKPHSPISFNSSGT